MPILKYLPIKNKSLLSWLTVKWCADCNIAPGSPCWGFRVPVATDDLGAIFLVSVFEGVTVGLGVIVG